MPKPNPGGNGLVITIEAVCRRCNANEPRDISVADWTQVKQNLSTVPGWKCSECGCAAAFWYVFRNVFKEVLEISERRGIDEEQGYLQPFACTIDEGFPMPPDFNGVIINPITEIAL